MEFANRVNELPPNETVKLEKIHKVIDVEPEFSQNKENTSQIVNKMAATEELKRDEKILGHVTASKVKKLPYTPPAKDSNKFKKLLDSTVASESKPLMQNKSFMEHKHHNISQPIAPRGTSTLSEPKLWEPLQSNSAATEKPEMTNVFRGNQPPRQPEKLRYVIEKLSRFEPAYESESFDMSQRANKLDVMEQIRHEIKCIPAEADVMTAAKFQGHMDETAKFAMEAATDTLKVAEKNLDKVSRFVAPKIASFADHVTNALNDRFPDDHRPESQKDPICSSTAKDDIRPGKPAAEEPLFQSSATQEPLSQSVAQEPLSKPNIHLD